MDKAKSWEKMPNAAVKCKNPGQKYFFCRFFFFEVKTIIQVFLRGLGKLTLGPLNGCVLNF